MIIEEAATYIIMTTNFKITVNINFVKEETELQQYAKWLTSFKDLRGPKQKIQPNSTCKDHGFNLRENKKK